VQPVVEEQPAVVEEVVAEVQPVVEEQPEVVEEVVAEVQTLTEEEPVVADEVADVEPPVEHSTEEETEAKA